MIKELVLGIAITCGYCTWCDAVPLLPFGVG